MTTELEIDPDTIPLIKAYEEKVYSWVDNHPAENQLLRRLSAKYGITYSGALLLMLNKTLYPQFKELVDCNLEYAKLMLQKFTELKED